MARPTRLALLLVCATIPLAFGLSACGGDDSSKDADEKSSTTAEAPSPAEDKAAVEQLLLAYGAAPGAKSCDYFAQNEIADYGGIEACRRKNADAAAVVYKVENVAVNGDTANAVITTAGKRKYYELIREGDPGGVGGGWRISSYPNDGVPSATEQAAAPTPEPETTTTTLDAIEDPEAVARDEVTSLLNDFGSAEGGEQCSFFADSLIASRGGMAACEKFFGDKPALDSKIIYLKVTVPIGKQDVVPAATAAIKSGQTGKPLYIGLGKTESPLDDDYGGWRITKQAD